MAEKSIYLETPVLFITYNRLETVKQSFACIKKAHPRKLYLASDGPKKDKPEDERKIKEVRAWIEQEVDWQCELHQRYSTGNQGCQHGPANAISWIFESEEQAIIIEDDIVADFSFFLYCQEMLERYKYDTRVMTVSGYKKVWDFPIKGDYFFSYFSPIWGWATWRRAWKYFDLTMRRWPYYKEQGLMQHMFWAGAVPSLTEEFDRTFEGKLDAWDYPWLFARLSNSGLGIVPRVNLITNVGFDSESATHTYGKAPEFHMGSLDFPLNYEGNVIRNWKYDREYERRFFKKKTFKRFIRKWIPRRILNGWYQMRGVR